MFPLNWKFLRLSHFEKIGGTGETDRQTDGRGATLNAAHKEGRIKIRVLLNYACMCPWKTEELKAYVLEIKTLLVQSSIVC